jgi:hypothetical protein
MNLVSKYLKLTTVAALLSILGAIGLTGLEGSHASGGSSETISWAGPGRDSASFSYPEFQNFEVSVSQTRNLTSQGVTVDWSGMSPSVPGQYSRNYVQIMQCWGTDTEALRQGCQWGTPQAATQNLVGTFAANRELSEDEDPLQEYIGSDFQVPPPSTLPDLKIFRVPFKPVNGNSTFVYEKYFAPESTNEVTAAPVGADGTGSTVFEIQTALEAPHLGCGSLVSGEQVKCWLVVVPRGEHYMNGSEVPIDESLSGSPLSASNWANRIEIPLEFAPLSFSCPIGNAERRVVGSELVSEAVTSWQPELCQSVATFGYSQIGDGEARRQLVSNLEGSAGLGFVNKPLSTEETGTARLVYTPVATSAIVVAFNIENQFKNTSPYFGENGKVVTSLKLNPRLLAKLLTQSYRADVPGGNTKTHVKNNPRSLRHDPEFLALNPKFRDFVNNAEPGGIVVALGSSDVAAMVWAWIRSDASARAFLAGEPDQYGMVLNKYYGNLELNSDLGIETFPKADLSYFRPNNSVPDPGFGTLDLRPYSNDLFEAAIQVRRADPKAKSIWDPTKIPAQFVSGGPQTIGQRFILAITDLPSAKRFGLNLATLISPAGAELNANASSISDAIIARTEDPATGMLVAPADPSQSPGYPLSTLTYAVTNACTQSAAAVTDYANFLEFATGAGQVSGESIGQLPEGYVPLSGALQARASDSIARLRAPDLQLDCPVIPPIDPGEPPVEPNVDPVDPGFPDLGPTPTEPGQSARNTIVYRTKTELSGSPLLTNLMLSSTFLGLPAFLIGSLSNRRKARTK